MCLPSSSIIVASSSSSLLCLEAGVIERTVPLESTILTAWERNVSPSKSVALRNMIVDFCPDIEFHLGFARDASVIPYSIGGVCNSLHLCLPSFRSFNWKVESFCVATEGEEEMKRGRIVNWMKRMIATAVMRAWGMSARRLRGLGVLERAIAPGEPIMKGNWELRCSSMV